MNIDGYYPTNNCLFCGSKLGEHPNKTRYCNCKSQYSVLLFTNSTFSVLFKIEDYKFHVGASGTVITDLTPKKPTYPVYRSPHPILINRENYLSVVERLKKLQTFS